jgi:hypothetical protein
MLNAAIVIIAIAIAAFSLVGGQILCMSKNHADSKEVGSERSISALGCTPQAQRQGNLLLGYIQFVYYLLPLY